MSQHQSNALWPAGTCSSKWGDNISTDTHYSIESAEGVCRLLEQQGLGGDRNIFPLFTWTSEIQQPPVLPAEYTAQVVSDWENNTGESDEWYTPPEVFAALGCQFDLDPCQPEQGRAFLSVPTDRFYTRADDGLVQPWSGFVFMNPPFGGRNGHVPWLQKFNEHGNGIAIVRAYTSAGWFHDYAKYADRFLFPRGKTKFIRPDGSVGKVPGSGVVLLARGDRAIKIMQRSGLGMVMRLDNESSGTRDG